MNTPIVDARDDTLDVRELVALLLLRKWLIIAVVSLCTATSWAAAFFMTPVYRVTSVLAPARSEGGLGGVEAAMGQLGGVAALAGISIGGGDVATEEAIAVLESSEFTQRFIVELNLLPKLYASKWDESESRWTTDPGREPTLARAAERFATDVRTVSRDRKTGLVTLSIDWRDREEALEWNRRLVAMVNEEMRGRALADAEGYIAHLENELASTSLVETRLAVGRLLDAQIRQRMMARVTREYAFRTVDGGTVPDADDPVRPKRAQMLVLGPVVGAILGVGYVILAWALGGTGPGVGKRRDSAPA